MYFEQFLNGGASQEPVSHVDILMMACEGAEFCGDAEVALIEEDGRLCMTVGAEGIGDAMAAVADKAKEIGTKIWKWLVEFMRRVRAFVSQAIVSLRSGAIISALKRIVAKAKSKARNEEWRENAPKPERLTKWRVDVTRALNSIYFVSEEGVKKYLSTQSKVFQKLDAAIGKTDAVGTNKEGNATDWRGGSDDDGTLDSILKEMPNISEHDTGMNYTSHDQGASGKDAHNTKFFYRLAQDSAFANAVKLSDGASNNETIIGKALDAANRLINNMKSDPILKIYDSLKLLDTEVNLVKKLAADAGKDGSKDLKRIKKIQKAISKCGTTATLFCRRQLGAYKKATALVMRMFSIAGSMEAEDYKED